MNPAKPPELHDRDHDWSVLARLWESRRAELGLVLGRRRVGKSHLLTRFAGAVDGLYYQATRRSEAEQLRAMTRLAGARFNDAALIHGAPFTDWSALLRYLADKAAGEPLLVVLDEYPYLEEAAPGISSVVQSWIDHDLPGTRLKVILSGSYISAMKRLEHADQPLYGRRTMRLAMSPFPYFHAAAFYPGYSARDRLLTYGVFGGLPGHLAMVEPERDFAANVIRHVLDPTARLFDEAQHVLDGFHGESEVHYSILSAIARGEHTWKGITSRIGKSSGSLSRPLQWLLDMELVRRDVPVTEPRPEKSRRALYRLADPHLAFWYRLVSPLIQAGTAMLVPPAEVWSTRIAPHVDHHMGQVFEDVARTFVVCASDLPFRPHRVGSWWDAAGTDEADVVAVGPDGELLVGECKWGDATAADLEALRRRAARIAAELGATRRIWLALFNGRAVTDSVLRAAIASGEVLHYDLKALFHGVE